MASTLIRALWFIFVGWWLAIIWIMISLILCLTLIGLPVGLWMLSKTWKIATLEENPMKMAQQMTQQVNVITSGGENKESPLAILKRKYAEGYITKAEYLKKKKILSDEDEDDEDDEEDKPKKKKSSKDED